MLRDLAKPTNTTGQGLRALANNIQPETSTAFSDWTGIQNANTYWQDALTQVKTTVMHPIQTIGNVIKAGINAFIQPIKSVYETNVELLKGGKKPMAERVADYVKALTADVQVAILPIYGTVMAGFEMAKEVPILSEAADVLGIPFATAGQLVSLPVKKFIDVLPIDQTSKDILKPAFGQAGELAGQIFLGGKILNMVIKQIPFTKETVDTITTEAKTESEQVKTTILEKSPDMVKSETFSLKKQEKVKEIPTIQKEVPMDIQEKAAEITMELQNATASKRIRTQRGDQVTEEKWIAQPSTFPDWIPSNLRSGDLFDTILKDIKNERPLNKKQTELVNVLREELAIRTGRNINEIPAKYLTSDILGKVSGVAKSIEAEAIKNNIIKNKLEDLAQYRNSTIEEQSKFVADEINKGIDNAREILRGEIPLPERISPFNFLIGMEEYIKKDPTSSISSDIAGELGNSPLVSKVSQAGSILGLGQERQVDSFVSRVQDIRKSQKERVEKTIPKVKELVEKGKTEINKKNLPKEDLLIKLSDYIDEIIC